jgi:hypothetical protein
MKVRRRLATTPEQPLLALKGWRLAAYLGLAAVAAALVQLMLGASFEVVAACLIAVALGLLGFLALGAYNFGSWVALFYALGNVLVALYAKTLLGQPLDSYLYAPVASFLALIATSGGLLAALLLVSRVNVGRPLFEGVSDPHFLSFLSWVCFGLGALSWLLNRWSQDPSGSGFGGISLFRDLLLMAVIARTAMLLERSGDRRTFDGWLGLIMSVCIFLGLIDNSKTTTALPVASYFATVLFYRRGLPARTMVVLVIGAVVFGSVVVPMTHALRALGQQELPVSQRIELVTSNAATLLEGPKGFERLEQLSTGQFEGNYYYYFGESGAGQIVLGRYASVQQIDPVIDQVNQWGPRGGAAVWPALAGQVPSFIYPNKPEYTEAYNTLLYYGLIHPWSGEFPTLPLAGQAYAGYGLLGLLTIPFITFFGFLLVVKKLGWQLYRNVYAIFFFCSFVLVYVGQGDFGQYAGAALRSFPLFAIVFWLVGQTFRFRPRFRLRSPLPPAERNHPAQLALRQDWESTFNDRR